MRVKWKFDGVVDNEKKKSKKSGKHRSLVFIFALKLTSAASEASRTSKSEDSKSSFSSPDIASRLVSGRGRTKREEIECFFLVE